MSGCKCDRCGGMFRTGELRRVHAALTDGWGKSFKGWDRMVNDWCDACRTVMHGKFKYARKNTTRKEPTP